MIVLVLVFLWAAPIYAAWDFTSDNVQLGDGAALTLPDADWSLCGWIKIESNTGTGTSNLFGWAAPTADPHLNMYCREATNGTAPNTITLLTEDASGAGDQLTFNSSGTPCATTTWQQLCLIRTGTAVLTLYLGGASIGTDSDVDYDDIDAPSSAWLGVDGDGVGVLLEDGHMAEWAKWDRALSVAEMTTLQKYAPSCLPGLVWYLPAIREYTEIKAGLTITNSNTVQSDHPPLLRCY